MLWQADAVGSTCDRVFDDEQNWKWTYSSVQAVGAQVTAHAIDHAICGQQFLGVYYGLNLVAA